MLRLGALLETAMRPLPDLEPAIAAAGRSPDTSSLANLDDRALLALLLGRSMRQTSIPAVDALFDRFGDIAAIASADVPELARASGLGPGALTDGVGGTDAWTALTRGRLRHLETLGLATRVGRRFRLAPDMEARLRRLQLSKDVIRTLNQRRLDGARSAEQLGKAPVHGKVVKAGFHDELGGSAFVVVRAADGSEHYGRLSVGKTPPAIGKTVTLSLDARGFAQVLNGKQLGQDLGR